MRRQILPADRPTLTSSWQCWRNPGPDGEGGVGWDGGGAPPSGVGAPRRDAARGGGEAASRGFTRSAGPGCAACLGAQSIVHRTLVLGRLSGASPAALGSGRVRILAIDGGGIRGLIPAVVLAGIERRTGRRTAELFDLIAGTSTGGILACGLTRPAANGAGGPAFTAADLIGLYESEGPEIFHRSLLKRITSAD